jgi:hypothetical protein
MTNLEKALFDLQHVVLDSNPDEMRKAVGKAIDAFREDDKAVCERYNRLKSQLLSAQRVLKMDDEIFRKLKLNA